MNPFKPGDRVIHIGEEWMVVRVGQLVSGRVSHAMNVITPMSKSSTYTYGRNWHASYHELTLIKPKQTQSNIPWL